MGSTLETTDGSIAGSPAQAGELRIGDVHHAYGDVVALDGIELLVEPGECLALLGPSGCGKSTLLNIIAGFVHPTRGSLVFRGQDWTDRPPHERGVGFVFQSYALFPHLRIRKNIAYGLAVRRAPKAETNATVERVADLLGIHELLDRFPSELSGGQQQRVALARAIAVEPTVLLLDEALSALDRSLREQMQVEISLLQRRLGITTIVVTHDMREAFSLGDRIAVMQAGRIEQIGRPEDLYTHPATPFVLGFLGTTTRVSDLGVVGPQPHVRVADRVTVPTPGLRPGVARADVILRGERIRLDDRPTTQHDSDPGTVELATFLGGSVRYVVDLAGTEIIVEQPTFGARTWQRGDSVYLAVDESAVAVEPRNG